MPPTGVRNSAPQLPLSLPDWQNAARASATALSSMGLGGLGIQAAATEEERADSALNSSLIAALAMLVIIVVVTVIAVRLSNRLARRLIRLRSETLRLADERLPLVVQRLRAGERIDVAAEVPDLDHGQDEIGQVAAAFNKAQQTAVAAAVQEAKTREGINAVFLNIARRSQAIVHRQLQVLDTAERASDDPDQLELLFQLDHSTTRERRNAENLIILGGGQLGRQWRNPVALIDIVRSAVAEAEQYTRVTINQVPNVLVDGRAVADLIHLLAELIDNATSFSPPGSRIEVRGNPVGRGVVVEVDDQGLGIEPERRHALNEMFRNPPDFGLMALSDDARIGFFVVAHLAHQHGIRVSLMESIYGGVRAGVLIPTRLMTSPEQANGDERAHGAGTPGGAPVEAPTVEHPRVDYPTVQHSGVDQPVEHSEAKHAANGSAGTGQLLAQRPAGDEDRPPLPRRRRQAHLSTRLYEEPAVTATDELHQVPEPSSDQAARHAR
ncbi:MAG TPA: ATP-binding protein, partial [Pseudonocardiaceae bacterium]|nr:ATP-binding protein [Pseudonocardiaceae bacterium]